MTETEDKAKEIYDYLAGILAEGVFISKKMQKEMIKEIEFLIDTS